MLINLVLLVFQGFIEILLLPLSAINITIDFLSSIPIVVQFLQVVAYIVPWSNLLPIFIFVVGLVLFRIIIALVRFIRSLIPLL